MQFCDHMYMDRCMLHVYIILLDWCFDGTSNIIFATKLDVYGHKVYLWVLKTLQ